MGQMEGSDWSAGGPSEWGKWRALIGQHAGEPILGQMDALIGQQADLQSGANEGI